MLVDYAIQWGLSAVAILWVFGAVVMLLAVGIRRWARTQKR